jgi:hypothetical protein
VLLWQSCRKWHWPGMGKQGGIDIDNDPFQLDGQSVIRVGINVWSELVRSHLPTYCRTDRYHELRRDKAAVSIQPIAYVTLPNWRRSGVNGVNGIGQSGLIAITKINCQFECGFHVAHNKTIVFGLQEYLQQLCFDCPKTNVLNT